jgi:hypothetical protein
MVVNPGMALLGHLPLYQRVSIEKGKKTCPRPGQPPGFPTGGFGIRIRVPPRRSSRSRDTLKKTAKKDLLFNIKG